MNTQHIIEHQNLIRVNLLKIQNPSVTVLIALAQTKIKSPSNTVKMASREKQVSKRRNTDLGMFVCTGGKILKLLGWRQS